MPAAFLRPLVKYFFRRSPVTSPPQTHLLNRQTPFFHFTSNPIHATMSGRFVKVAGVGLVAGAGYYLYQAGGQPKVAEKKFEHDAAKLSSKIRGDLPGAEKEAKTGIKLAGEEASAKFDSAAAQLKDSANKTENKLSAYANDASKKLEDTRKEVGSTLMAGVDKFDKTVEKKASETKGWLGGWFGGSK
ncbi:uncharacterized protein PV09_01673 [Verruconis gallopava]|uniref:Uncharacterized protein n=1 Tax=Verruconis gallopava TaxID=253628 RepID=A0A0D2ALU6_9PEZI|nr:uncharacterized protein PV09_01673 [Verruconis gallopava]KIW07743.1 hypothetical protein PV09_01673 [Verruconis gallopava]